MSHLPMQLDWTYIVGAFLLSVPGYLTWFSSRAASKAAANKVEAVSAQLTNNATAIENKVELGHQLIEQKVEEIHKVVNSERTAMLEKIEEMHATILSLTQEAAKK